MNTISNHFKKVERENLMKSCVDLLGNATFLENTLARLHPTFDREYTSKETEILKYSVSTNTAEESYFHPTLNELAKTGMLVCVNDILVVYQFAIPLFELIVFAKIFLVLVRKYGARMKIVIFCMTF